MITSWKERNDESKAEVLKNLNVFFANPSNETAAYFISEIKKVPKFSDAVANDDFTPDGNPANPQVMFDMVALFCLVNCVPYNFNPLERTPLEYATIMALKESYLVLTANLDKMIQNLNLINKLTQASQDQTFDPAKAFNIN